MYSRQSLNSPQERPRNLLQKHPFAFVVVTLALGFFAFVQWSDMNTPPPQKLDYSKPIVTGYSSMICPQSLLYDIRASHDGNALFLAFTAITGRSEKAEALGCEIVREGIPVQAKKMMGDNFVAISISGLSGSFFTTESQLENPEGSVSISSPSGGMDSLATATESARVDFRKAFPTLDKSLPNLRWFQDQIEGEDAQESASLITPYGGCIDLVGNRSAGYSLLFDGNYYHAPHEKGTIVGVYQDRLTAIHAAEDYCHRWYLTERNEPPNVARDSHIWFAPESEATASTDQVPAAITAASSPDRNGVYWNIPPAERDSMYPQGISEGTQSPAPIERVTAPSVSPPLSVQKSFHWTTDANGDRKLIGSKGTCATIASDGPSGFHLTLSDGSTMNFDNASVALMQSAMLSAETYCQTN